MIAETVVDMLLEMPVISRQGKSVLAGDVELRDVPVAAVLENIVIFYQPAENNFVPKGFMLAFFMDSAESAQAMKEGKIPYKYVHNRIRSQWDSSPITDVWKKSQDEGQHNILGVVQGHVDEQEIYVDKMTVRPGYKRHTINTKLIQALQDHFSGRTTNFSGPTKDGSRFIKAFTGSDWKPAHGETAEIR